MQYFQVTRNGHSETGMYRRLSMMVSNPGEEGRELIDRARWRNHFIGTKQSLEGNYRQGEKRVEK